METFESYFNISGSEIICRSADPSRTNTFRIRTFKERNTLILQQTAGKQTF